MDKICKSILIGSILGDGHLDPITRNGSRWILKYDDDHMRYLEWLRSKALDLQPSSIKAKKNYHQHYFSTKPSSDVGFFRRHFYPKGIKIVPKDVKLLLTDPLSLAIWYMDDGSLDKREKYHLNATFATFCFSFRECVLLASTLKENFGIEARVHKSTMRGKERYRLYIVSGSMTKFVNVVGSYIQPDFRYKIAL